MYSIFFQTRKSVITVCASQFFLLCFISCCWKSIAIFLILRFFFFYFQNFLETGKPTSLYRVAGMIHYCICKRWAVVDWLTCYLCCDWLTCLLTVLELVNKASFCTGIALVWIVSIPSWPYLYQNVFNSEEYQLNYEVNTSILFVMSIRKNTAFCRNLLFFDTVYKLQFIRSIVDHFFFVDH